MYYSRNCNCCAVLAGQANVKDLFPHQCIVQAMNLCRLWPTFRPSMSVGMLCFHLHHMALMALSYTIFLTLHMPDRRMLWDKVGPWSSSMRQLQKIPFDLILTLFLTSVFSRSRHGWHEIVKGLVSSTKVYVYMKPTHTHTCLWTLLLWVMGFSLQGFDIVKHSIGVSELYSLPLNNVATKTKW